MSKRSWTEISPKDAMSFQLPHPEIQGPFNEMGVECPWPWEPQQLGGTPLGQYHCPYCGGMVVAGVPHFDFTPDEQYEIQHQEPKPAHPTPEAGGAE